MIRIWCPVKRSLRNAAALDCHARRSYRRRALSFAGTLSAAICLRIEKLAKRVPSDFANPNQEAKTLLRACTVGTLDVEKVRNDIAIDLVTFPVASEPRSLGSACSEFPSATEQKWRRAFAKQPIFSGRGSQISWRHWGCKTEKSRHAVCSPKFENRDSLPHTISNGRTFSTIAGRIDCSSGRRLNLSNPPFPTPGPPRKPMSEALYIRATR